MTERRAFAATATVPAFFAALALSGCLASPPGPSPEVTAHPLMASLELTDCQVRGMKVLLDSAAVQASLPEGFQAAPYDGVPGQTLGEYVLYDCRDGRTENGTALGPSRTILGDWEVVPPDEQAGNASRFLMTDGGYSDSEAVMAWLFRQGFGNVVPGAISLSESDGAVAAIGNLTVAESGLDIHWSALQGTGTTPVNTRLFFVDGARDFSLALQGHLDVDGTTQGGPSAGVATASVGGLPLPAGVPPNNAILDSATALTFTV